MIRDTRVRYKEEVYYYIRNNKSYSIYKNYN